MHDSRSVVVFSLAHANASLSPVTFGVDSGAEVSVMSPDTASDHPREHGQKNAIQLVDDMVDVR